MSAIEKFLDNLPAIIIGLTGLIVAYTKLRQQLALAIEGTAQNRETIKGLTHTVNSTQERIDAQRKAEADEKQNLAVQLAKLEMGYMSAAQVRELEKLLHNLVTDRAIKNTIRIDQIERLLTEKGLKEPTPDGPAPPTPSNPA